MPKKHLALNTQAEVDHLSRLLHERGYKLVVDRRSPQGVIWVSSDAENKAWNKCVIKFKKQQVIQDAANGNNEQKLML